MSKKNANKLTRKEVSRLISYYTQLDIPVSLELRLILARINADTQRNADYPRLFKLITRDLGVTI